MIKYWISSDRIRESVYLPKYYDPKITRSLESLTSSHELLTINHLIEQGIISISVGDEIGKMAYGTGNIPFVRTSDISNWEIRTLPKQGVSEEIYAQYAPGQDVREGDILLVRDGTYLIGTNCFITKVDRRILFQSHLIKIRVLKRDKLAPELLFLLFNSSIVQQQFRSFQFTADVIDTMGRRFLEVILPIPRSEHAQKDLARKVAAALDKRVRGKALIKNAALLFEACLELDSIEPLESFLSSPIDDLLGTLKDDTIAAEFGGFTQFWRLSDQIKRMIFIPKYYDPATKRDLKLVTKSCDLHRLSSLRSSGQIAYQTGDEIGKMAYGTGSIPFIRTSDFSNWEIKHDTKQGISKENYDEYSEREDLQVNDILLVRDGTYLVGSSCLVTEEDKQSLYCGGLIRLRSCRPDELDPFLFLALLNSYLVKRQIRNRQFTRDVIDTLGNRIGEVQLPIPKSVALKRAIGDSVRAVVLDRIGARREINELSRAALETTIG